MSPAQKFDTDRSSSWPPTSRITTEDFDSLSNQSAPTVMITTPPIRISNAAGDATSYYEDQLNKHPEDHFLSPVQKYEYEDWQDSDDDGEDVEWDAGITDFALFNDDRRRAQADASHKLPDKWDHLLASQASALQRAVQRNRADSDPQSRNWTPLLNEIPQLTPDNSPSMRDGFDMDAHFATHGHKPPQSPRPDYLQFRPTRASQHDFDDAVASASDDSDFDSEDEDDDDLPLSLIISRAKERQRAARIHQRPGLRYSRTLSGKLHVWRRPSHELYSLGEDVAAERKAERDYMQESEATEERGRER